MASPDNRKILRVGVIHKGTIIEERLLRRREPVTVGTQVRNTFTIAGEKVPSRFAFFEVRNGQYFLAFNQDMTGRISVGQGVHSLASLREHGKAVKRGNVWSVALDERSRGKVVVGDIIFLFQFVAPPPERPAPQLPVALRGGPLQFLNSTVELTGVFGVALLLSFMLQVGFVVWAHFIPPPPRSVGIADLPDEIRMLLTQVQETEEVRQDESTDGEVVAEVIEEAEEVIEDVVEPEDRNERATPEAAPSDPEQRLQQARERVREQSFFGAMYTSETGQGAAMDQVFNTTDRSVSHILQRQQARGEGGLASSGSLASGSNAGGEGEGQVVGVDVESSGTRDRARETDSGNERERVRVQADIQQGRTQRRGTGRIDEDSLNSELRRRSRDIRRCYERVLASDPDLGGRIVLVFTINGRGRVEDVRLPENEVGDEVGNCIEGRVRRWRFDEPEGGEVMVRKTYILSPSG